jgi:hypothetical protein
VSPTATFFSWWYNELRELGASALARIAPGIAARAVVRLSGGAGSISITRGDDDRRVLELPGLDDATLTERTLPDELREKLRGMRATLVLGADQVLTEELAFPRAVERQLDRVLEIHVERHSPLQRALVYIAHRVVARDRASNRITVNLLLAHARTVDRARDLAMSWGLRVVRIGTEDSTGEVVGDFVAHRHHGVQLHSTKLDRWLAVSAAALAGALLCAIGGQWIYERVQLAHEVGAATAAAAEAQELIRRFEQLAAPALALTGVMTRPDALEVLSALTERVPDDSWVYELEIRSPPERVSELELWAFSSAPGQLIDLLEQSPEFAQVRLESTATVTLTGNAQERVQLTAKAESQ